MKEIYLDIMETALNAYDKERILAYIDEVKNDGLTEHGFARLAANLAILNAFGRCTEYFDIMLEMMDMCCEKMPETRAANEFSVREIVCALNLCREKKTVSEERIQKWTSLLAGFDPYTKYNVVTKPFESKGNWAAFGAVSEIVRSKLCGIDSSVFIDNQISSLLNDFDENGMYKDPHNPMVYDYVTRVLLDYMLYAGYNGQYRAQLEDKILKAAPFSIKLQSVTGEMPFGGRSNQFFHNQMWIAADYEFLATFFASRGETEKAGEFKAAALCAAKNLAPWFGGKSLRSLKNRYPVDSMIGCEGYGYFNKYMITLASMAYLAYQFADDSIRPTEAPCEKGGYVCRTSDTFHKVVLNGFGYSMEIDTNADFHYDACGLGKLQKYGSPDTLCLSVPFPPSGASYKTEKDNIRAMSLCPYLEKDGKTLYGSEYPLAYAGERVTDNEITARFTQEPDGNRIELSYSLSSAGAELKLTSATGFMLPVFEYDGESFTKIMEKDGELAVSYQNHICRFLFDAPLDKQFERYYNRNGRYRVYKIPAKSIRITFEEESI